MNSDSYLKAGFNALKSYQESKGDEWMDQVDYEALTAKLGEVTLMNKQLKRANTNMKREVKNLRRQVKKLTDEISKNRKPHYKNGKRGTKFNG
jgi:predicted RNase H-like nuclease (RuvC/YqgF family)